MEGTVSWEQLLAVVSFLGSVGALVWWISKQHSTLHLENARLTARVEKVEAGHAGLDDRLKTLADERMKLYDKVQDLLVRFATTEAHLKIKKDEE